MSYFRNDIQALRGIAVLVVLFYHSKLFALPGGYLGVDLFFVISGYLITGQIRKTLSEGSFSFKEFYLRRAWRLLPAAYAVFLICIICAPWVLTQHEFADFQAQLLGAVTFSANIALWLQTGYFESSSELKPLLHTWSLSIEEQYYLVIPLLLFFVARRKHFLVIASLTLLSFCILAYFSSRSPGASFYLTPSRVWELGVGSLISFFSAKSSNSTFSIFRLIPLFIISAAVLGYIPDSPISEMSNLLVVIATSVLIQFPASILNQGMLSKVLSWFGGISYPLYLVHWPLFSFYRSASIEYQESPSDIIALIIISIVLAYLLHKLIEVPNRITRKDEQKSAKPLIVISILLIIFGMTIKSPERQNDWDEVYAANRGLSASCDNFDEFNSPACRSSEVPNVLLWGDSFAMHLAQAIAENPKAKISQATKSVCSPIPQLAINMIPDYPKEWGENCISFNQKILDLTILDENVELIVLASPWENVLSSDMLTVVEHGFAEEIKSNADATALRLSRLIAENISKLRAAGKRVVVVSPPPSSGFNIARCYERSSRGLLTIGASGNCVVDRLKSDVHRQRTHAFLNTLEKEGIPIYRFEKQLCDESTCKTKLEGTILYRDEAHLSIKGSQVYGEKYSLYDNLLKIAK